MIVAPAFAETNTVSSTVTGTTTVDKTPGTASAPNVMINNQDVCSTGVSAAVQTQVLGVAAGTTVRDLNCERIKLSKVLYDYGMKVAAVSILCQDPRVHAAMQSAGSPCPWDGKIGKNAQEMWDKYPELRPDYEEFLAKSEAIAKIDERILREEAKELARLEAERLKKEEAEKQRLEEEAKKEKERLKKIEENKKIVEKPSIQVHD